MVQSEHSIWCVTETSGHSPPPLPSSFLPWLSTLVEKSFAQEPRTHSRSTFGLSRPASCSIFLQDTQHLSLDSLSHRLLSSWPRLRGIALFVHGMSLVVENRWRVSHICPRS